MSMFQEIENGINQLGFFGCWNSCCAANAAASGFQLSALNSLALSSLLFWCTAVSELEAEQAGVLWMLSWKMSASYETWSLVKLVDVSLFSTVSQEITSKRSVSVSSSSADRRNTDFPSATPSLLSDNDLRGSPAILELYCRHALSVSSFTPLLFLLTSAADDEHGTYFAKTQMNTTQQTKHATKTENKFKRKKWSVIRKSYAQLSTYILCMCLRWAHETRINTWKISHNTISD